MIEPISAGELATIGNMTLFDSFIKCESVLKKYTNIMVAVSGGADSDCMVDMIERTRGNIYDKKNIHYVWFNTGLEYQASKNHLTYLENKYGITIEREKARKVIPTTVREFGLPFVNKYASEMIYRLQLHNFQWEDGTVEELVEKYPGCKESIRWWCDDRTYGHGNQSMYNISRNKYLKEFLMANPPEFKISQKCCYWAKKLPSYEYEKEHDIELVCLGLRRAEGGIRAKVGTCFSDASDKRCAIYRPLYWYKDSDRKYYSEQFNLQHSECYTKYGFKRTGCVGCPYNMEYQKDLEAMKNYEPNLYKACMNIFGKSYAYTEKYREFQRKMKEEEQRGDQISLFDLVGGE